MTTISDLPVIMLAGTIGSTRNTKFSYSYRANPSAESAQDVSAFVSALSVSLCSHPELVECRSQGILRAI